MSIVFTIGHPRLQLRFLAPRYRNKNDTVSCAISRSILFSLPIPSLLSRFLYLVGATHYQRKTKSKKSGDEISDGPLFEVRPVLKLRRMDPPVCSFMASSSMELLCVSPLCHGRMASCVSVCSPGFMIESREDGLEGECEWF